MGAKDKKLLKLSNTLAQLRYEAAKKTTGNANPQLRARMRKQYEKLTELATQNQSLEVLETKKKTTAALMRVPDTSAFFGVKVQSIVIDYKLNDARSRNWLVNTISRQKKFYHKKTVIFLPIAYKKILPSLLKSGFSIDSLILQGDPKTSLKLLIRKVRPATDLNHLGLQFRRARRSDIPKILNISRKEFSRNPQYGWFCASPKFLQAQKQELIAAMKDPLHSHYVIERNRKFLGYFGSDAVAGAQQAGITLMFDKSIQGKGIAKTAYKILLEDMVVKKVKKYRGGTSQLPVMKLAKLMNRNLVLCLLRYHVGYFPIEHFGTFIN